VRTAALVISALARGCGLFYGGLAMLAVAAELRGRTADMSLWWIDLRMAAAPARIALLVLVAGVLVAWALVRSPGRRVRVVMAVTAATVAVIAARDTLTVLAVTGTGLVHPAVPVPLSAVTAAGFGLLSVHAALSRTARMPLRWRGGLGLALAVGVWAVAFPLAQMLWFGATDYRRPADAAVVLGARVYASGQPSPLLGDRVRTGIELYRAGLAPRLVMSGGDGADGFNEARVMADMAIREGVPASAVIVDPAGNTTELTVRNSMALLAAAGAPDRPAILVVSQAYHLPRVQLAFSNAGIDVLTVPAPEARPIADLPLSIAREVPAFWSYLLRVCLL
jgi:vancomycin permeability regulator SanA